MSEPSSLRIVDEAVYNQSLSRFREAGIRLPTLSELADPSSIDTGILAALESVDADAPHPLNLFRVHWFNDGVRKGQTAVPGHLVIPPELSGVEAKIVVATGDRFPMIGAHKVLAAYGCLVPRLVTGAFDIARQRAVWPSTGNYCRGGVAISRILGCKSVAVLPEGMSEERFRWLENWVLDPADIVRTPGSESNLKEIYDACRELARDPGNVILNQFSEFGNYVAHRVVTGRALETLFEAVKGDGGLKARAFVCASGSSGTLGAGDYLKERLGTEIAVVEALECPTLLMNGYGEHNIQGIGDKHIPLIHNVFNTDYVIGVSDGSSDSLNLLFNTEVGCNYLRDRKRIGPTLVSKLSHLGLSAIANVVAAIKLCKYLRLGADDAILTVATDGAAMYGSELEKIGRERFAGRFDEIAAAEVFGEHLAGIRDDALEELTRVGKERIFNLGYYTWVEQQGVSLADFDRRRDQAFWDGLVATVPDLDAEIRAFNAAAA